MKLIFATHNNNKINEIAKITPEHIEVLSLSEIGFNEEIPETELTLEGNAKLKVDAILKNKNVNCFSDDSGLFVEALNGDPGVFSARYSGERDTAMNNELLLRNMKSVESRSAYYMSVFCLYFKGTHHFFEGRLYGEIADHPKGSNGFGYDPIFIPNGYTSTLGELSEIIKLELSHRTIALNKMKEFLALNS
ncbi:MAG: non-canonical purine NTP pyrophosphatase, RdgB/HAM1 family [Flavobacteriaceae bacterium]|nr:non-canonical purine NTP pyrophosphatase, RdgB/HAM1 family [Flavobacteriaceae bacterium]